jgi:hypothetical protein
MSMSETIREFAKTHPIFGAQEIREQYGDKAAKLVTRLAAKGMFTRVQNGVFALDGYDADQDEYQNYLLRRHEAMVERAQRADASITDQFLYWASAQTTFSQKDASDHFGQDMKGWVHSYLKSRKLEHVGHAAYRYIGYHPAARRDQMPMAKPHQSDDQILASTLTTHVMTVAQISAATDLDSKRTTTIINRLVAENKVLPCFKSSFNQPQYYYIPNTLSELPPGDAAQLLSYIAERETVTVTQAWRHSQDQTQNRIHELLARALISPLPRQSSQNQTRYQLTTFGIKQLKDMFNNANQ